MNTKAVTAGPPVSHSANLQHTALTPLDLTASKLGTGPVGHKAPIYRNASLKAILPSGSQPET